MTSVLYPICALAALIALLYRLPDLRTRPRDLALIALATYFGTSFLTFALSTPVVWTSVDRVTQIPNLAGMLAQCGALTLGVVQQLIVVGWESPGPRARRRIQRRVLALMCVLVAMAVLFARAVPSMESRPTDFAVVASHIPAYAIYLIVYLAGFSAAMAESVRLCWRYAKVAGRPWLRRGLRTAAVGSALGLVYAAVRITDIIAVRLDIDASQWETIARLGAGLGVLAMIIGWTMPSWGPSVSALRAWLIRYRDYHRLLPLWTALLEIVPGVALNPPRNPRLEAWTVRHLDFRVYRRIMEIRDAQLALQPYLRPELARIARELGRARGLTGVELDATVEAAALADAVRTKRQTGATPSGADDLHHNPDLPAIGGEDLPDELTWLANVATAFAHSPVVTATLNTAASAATPATRDPDHAQE